jgi:hypothetical protein
MRLHFAVLSFTPFRHTALMKNGEIFGKETVHGFEVAACSNSGLISSLYLVLFVFGWRLSASRLYFAYLLCTRGKLLWVCLWRVLCCLFTTYGGTLSSKNIACQVF